jgi:hypothetical protein
MGSSRLASLTITGTGQLNSSLMQMYHFVSSAAYKLLTPNAMCIQTRDPAKWIQCIFGELSSFMTSKNLS